MNSGLCNISPPPHCPGACFSLTSLIYYALQRPGRTLHIRDGMYFGLLYWNDQRLKWSGNFVNTITKVLDGISGITKNIFFPHLKACERRNFDFCVFLRMCRVTVSPRENNLKTKYFFTLQELPGGVHIVLVFAQERHLNDMSIYNIYRVNKKSGLAAFWPI